MLLLCCCSAVALLSLCCRSAVALLSLCCRSALLLSADSRNPEKSKANEVSCNEAESSSAKASERRLLG
jgi:hypothetical protein